MEVEEVQVKLEDEAKAGDNTSEQVLVDEELLQALFDTLSDPFMEDNFSCFYRVNDDKEVEYFNPGYIKARYWPIWFPITNPTIFNQAKEEGSLAPELSNLSFEEIKKLGETSAPGVYFKGKKVWDL